jgi:murein DD-endopeptidase MepM/ murein hydrolase activator NlpD
LQQQQQVIDQYRGQVSQQKQQLQQMEGAARERLGGLQQDLQATDAKLAENEAKLESSTQALAKLEAELAIAEGNYKNRRDSTVARLQYLQRHQRTQNWTTLLHSETLEDLLDQRYRLKRVYEADQKGLLELKQEADRINAQKLEAETEKNRIALLTQQLSQQKSQFQAQSTAQQDLVLRLNTDQRALEAAETQLSNDSKQLSSLIETRLALKSIYPEGKPPLIGTGQMMIPASGPITSPFGNRIHPILGTSRFHAGLDVGAEEGSPIVAADQGTVIIAEWYGGYGNAVIIDHGNNLTTLYGHASQLYVTVGQQVQKGQMIAAVGTTGLSTGPHLHFEVRVQGEPTDPIAYL